MSIVIILNWTHSSANPKLSSPPGENSMFVISGATGNTGSVVVKTLIAAGQRVRALVRSEAKAAELKALGAELFVADFTDPAALERAVTGADGVYFLSAPDITAKDFV